MTVTDADLASMWRTFARHLWQMLVHRWRSLLLTGLLLYLLIALFELADHYDCLPMLGDAGRGAFAGLATLYLLLGWLLFLATAAAKVHVARRATRRSPPSGVTSWPVHWLRALAASLDRHELVISLGLAVILLPIFAHTHQIPWVNNLSIALAYLLLLFRIVLWVHDKTSGSGHPLGWSGHRIYIAYAALILLLIAMVPAVDGRDPYGVQFQLQFLCGLLTLHLVASWMLAQRRLGKQLQAERTQAELALLKNQIHPHFLFNTLNNLYGLAREKSEQTPDLILRLAALLRHTVYQGDKDKVCLGDEIDYLKAYIQLHQLRYAKPVVVEFDCELDRLDYRIAPLLLIVLLENAYKHGVEPSPEAAYIKLRLRANGQRLQFSIENSVEAPLAWPTSASGMGLGNLRRRLDLEYPHSHQLQLDTGSGCFRARLDLPLSMGGTTLQ